jgi:hypothetical protein
MESSSHRFAIALSFPGERRGYVEAVARLLLPAFGGDLEGKTCIFYDRWHEASIIGYASNRRLQQAYKDADLIVPFYCQDYIAKDWCGVELRVIEDRLQKQEFDTVLPFRFDGVEIPGGFSQDIVLNISGYPVKRVASLILDRYKSLQDQKVSDASESRIHDGAGSAQRGRPTHEVSEPLVAEHQGPSRLSLAVAAVFSIGIAVAIAVSVNMRWSSEQGRDVQTGSPSSVAPSVPAGLVAGVVTDAKGAPVPGAVVTLDGRPERGKSQTSGNFSIELQSGLSGRVRLRVSAAGYDDYDEVVNVPNQRLEIQLQQQRRGDGAPR